MEERRETNPRVNFLINIAYWAVIVAIIFLVFKYLINIMMPIFLAFIFAAVVRPISRALSRETRYVRGKDGNKVLVKRKFHMNRNVAGIISVLVLFIVVGGLLTLIVVRLTDIPYPVRASGVSGNACCHRRQCHCCRRHQRYDLLFHCFAPSSLLG